MPENEAAVTAFAATSFDAEARGAGAAGVVGLGLGLLQVIAALGVSFVRSLAGFDQPGFRIQLQPVPLFLGQRPFLADDCVHGQTFLQGGEVFAVEGRERHAE